jgi:insertion element IS1 protein InsB
MIIRDICPQCQSPKYKKNGHIPHGKQNYQYKDCGRQLVDCLAQNLVSDDTRALIERLLVERISLRGICRAMGVTLQWLLGCLLKCFEALPDHLHAQPATCKHNVMIQCLEVEADEMASFVPKKTNKPWIWIAMDATSRQVIAFHVGDRSRRSAKRFWAKMPAAHWQHAAVYTDQYVVYEGVIPAAQHWAISQLARKTNHVERFNNMLRQRVSRLVRGALSFSKKLAHHIGATNMFICHYNLAKAAASSEPYMDITTVLRPCETAATPACAVDYIAGRWLASIGLFSSDDLASAAQHPRVSLAGAASFIPLSRNRRSCAKPWRRQAYHGRLPWRWRSMRTMSATKAVNDIIGMVT